jgi:formate dehydrogenase major subunit/formate dehydrogenase alpha subunit
VLCGRCVRACGEIQNREVWSFAHRGFKTKLAAGADQHMLEARCESCGQCVAYCPVGALYDKMSLGTARANKVNKIRTVCSYCGVGCGFDLNVRDGRAVRVTSAPDAPVNGMALCVKGRYGYDYIHHSDRLTKPLVRRELVEGPARPTSNPPADQPVGPRRWSEFVEVGWETALDLVAGRFAEVKQIHGGDALALFASAKCTNEENYLFNKFARQVLGTNNIDHCARL